MDHERVCVEGGASWRIGRGKGFMAHQTVEIDGRQNRKTVEPGRQPALAALINSRDLSLNVLLRAHIRNHIICFTTITELVKQVYQNLYKQF